MNDAADLTRYNIQAEKFNVALADNTAKTICVIPTGRRCVGCVIAKFIGESDATIDSLNWAVNSGSLVITPQIYSNLSGNAEVLALFAR